jgi:hypothetical protein
MEPHWQEAVRIRAYQIWEAEGRPEGRALEHWAQAVSEMGTQAHQISRLSSADSVLTLLSRVDIEKFPPEERMAVSTVQVEALDEWLSASLLEPGPVETDR